MKFDEKPNLSTVHLRALEQIEDIAVNNYSEDNLLAMQTAMMKIFKIAQNEIRRYCKNTIRS